MGSLLIGELGNKALRFAAAAVLARTLSPAEFGDFNVAIALSGILLIGTSLGLADTGARAVAVGAESPAVTSGRVVALRVTVLAPVAGLAFGMGAFVWPGHAGLLSAAIAMSFAMSLSGDWVARGLERMNAVGRASALGGAVALAGTVIVALASASALWALWAYVVAEGIVTLACWRSVRMTGRPRLTLIGAGALVRRTWPVGLSALAAYSYQANLDTVLIAAFRSSAEAGLYSAAYRIFLLLNVIATFAAYALLPRVSREVAAGRLGGAARLLGGAIPELAAYGFVALGAIELAGEPLLALLFGPRFVSMAPTLTVLAVAVAWYAVGYPVGYGLMAGGRGRSFLAGAGTAGLLAFALDLLLIPPYGALGAAAATLIAFVVATLIWLKLASLLGRGLRMTLATLTTASVLALLTVFVPSTGTMAVVLTLLMAIFTVAAGRRGPFPRN
ncbi:MAG: oligosaccharide flippase family protein [Thermoleophilaceae bacterium]